MFHFGINAAALSFATLYANLMILVFSLIHSRLLDRFSNLSSYHVENTINHDRYRVPFSS